MLPTILALAAIDSFNPSPIIGAMFLAGGLLVGMGIRSWCQGGSLRRQSAPAAHLAGRSGLVLGFLATLADVPTAGLLLGATLLLAGGDASALFVSVGAITGCERIAALV